MLESLDRAPAYRLHRVQRLLRAHLLGMLSPFDLTPEQYLVLMRLGQESGVSQGELGDPTLDDRGSVSRQVGLLEQRGLIERLRSPSDRRSVEVHLTESGRELLAGITPAVQAERERLFGGVPPEDLDALHRVLDHLEVTLGAARPS